VSARIARRRRLMLGALGQQVSPQVAQSLAQAQSNAPTLADWISQNSQYWDPFTAAFWAPTDQVPQPASSSGGPSWSAGDVLYGAATGNVPSGVKQQIITQNAADLVNAGMPADMATDQATSDVNAALNQATGPGAFGITWQGAQPGGTNWVDQATADLGTSWLGQNWIWLALGGLGILFISKRL
jgi:hypothetical protein